MAQRLDVATGKVYADVKTWCIPRTHGALASAAERYLTPLSPVVRIFAEYIWEDLGRYRQPLWVVFPFFNVDRGFQSRELNASQDLLSKITSYPDTFADASSEYFPSLPPKLALKRSYDDSDLFPRRFKTPVVDGLPSMMMGRQSLYRFFLPDYEGEEMIENQQLSTLKGREQLMVDQWWILMPDENCVTTLCTSEDQTNLHLSLRVRHPLLIALDIIRQYTQDSTNDSFDFDRVMEYYDGMILDIGLEQHREFSRLQVLQTIESKRIMQLNRILDEMKMISHVLAQQVVVVKKLGEAIDLFDWKTGRMVGTEPPNGNPVEPFENPRLGKLGYEDAGRILKEITNNISRHQEQVDGIVESARSARDIEFQLLNLKQANTNFHESRVVTVFTVITIIFLPLSFLTGFFGMNVKEISGNSNTYTLGYFWLWAGTSCAVVVILAFLVAFNRKTREMTGRAREKFRRYRTDLEKGPKEHLA
ncbi:cora-like Mg2+ transporter protein-domain-containing protein [Trichophaea hybrida]|nr:cora-like Mg2+ transporter protein-domain-containing protein [Trichophaea hybrida]